jgi:hypothetical protein
VRPAVWMVREIGASLCSDRCVRAVGDYAEAARGRELPVALSVLPGRHHYSILDELSRPEGKITRALVKLIELNG